MAKIIGHFCGYPVVLADSVVMEKPHAKQVGAHLWEVTYNFRSVYRASGVSYPMQLADEIGNKCCASLALIDRRRKVVPVSLDEWHGLNAMERDDQL